MTLWNINALGQCDRGKHWDTETLVYWDQALTNIRYPEYYLVYFQPSIRSRNTSHKPDLNRDHGSVYVQCMDHCHLSVLSSLCESQLAAAMVWLWQAVTHTAKMTRTGDSGPYTVHTLNHDPGLNPIYVKYSRTKYWAENKPDSIPDTGYSSKSG